RRVERAGVAGRVDLRLQDYRDVGGRYDHIVSVEMFEAVGEAYWPVYMETLKRRLRPGGRAALQVITIDEAAFGGYRRGADFIQRYIFPGGMLPSVERLTGEARAAGLRVRGLDRFGGHYARTLAEWHRRFLAAVDEVRMRGYDERFIRMWRYYLAYCEAGFRQGRIDLVHVGLEHA
ncbi:MAG: class I SAM-dependent methyltransferase, partial [Chromatiales bacterium]